MNDKQFEALLGGIAAMVESIDNLSERVTMVAATIAKASDSEGCESVLKSDDYFPDVNFPDGDNDDDDGGDE